MRYHLPVEIYLIRHGESEGNVRHAGGGRHDWPLSKLGKAQADALSRAPFASRLTHIFASPLSRAQDTATTLAKGMRYPETSAGANSIESPSNSRESLSNSSASFPNLPENPALETDERLIDVDAGELNGAEWSVIRENHMDFFRSVPRNPGLAFPGGGESNRDVIERTRSFAEFFKSRFRITSAENSPNAEHRYDSDAHIAVVGHGLPLNYLLQLLLELEPAGIECFQLANASVTQVSFKLTYPVLAVYNDVSHLANLRGAPPFSQGIETDRGPAPGE